MGMLEVQEQDEEKQFSAVVRENASPGQAQNEKPLLDFKKTLMEKLAGSSGKKKALE